MEVGEELGDITLEDEEGRVALRVRDADSTVLEGRVSLEEEEAADGVFAADVVEDIGFERFDNLTFGFARDCAPEPFRPRKDRDAVDGDRWSASSYSSDAGTTSGMRWRFLGGCGAVGMLTVMLTTGFVENATGKKHGRSCIRESAGCF